MANDKERGQWETPVKIYIGKGEDAVAELQSASSLAKQVDSINLRQIVKILVQIWW